MPVVKQLEQLWNSASTPPDVFALLKRYPAADSDQYLAVLLADQRQRWRTSMPLQVEDYLAGLPELPGNVDWRLQLAIGEFEARRDASRPLSVHEIKSRFPDLIDALSEPLQQGADDLSPTMPVAQAAALMKTETGILQSESPELSYISSTAIGVQQKGRYRLDRVLGEGAFGRVYRGFDEELQRLVAI
jgi:hypothetical protein